MQYNTSYSDDSDSELKSERKFNKRPFRTMAFWSFFIFLAFGFPLMEYISQGVEHAKQVLLLPVVKSGEFITYVGDWFKMLTDSSIPSYYQGLSIYIPLLIVIAPIFCLLLGWILEMVYGMMDTGMIGQRKRRF